MNSFLDFERPLAELEGKIKELRLLGDSGDLNLVDEIHRLQSKAERLLRQTYGKLTPWQKTQVARHAGRPRFGDYVGALVTDFTPIAGDRAFGDDSSIVAGLGRFRGFSAMILGHEKGFDTESRLKHNFGMARPEGYRKATRAMSLAERFGLPVVSLVDTPGAWPGIGAEERGQAEAIARSIEKCLDLRVPVVGVIVGEGGSGGAIALAAANHVAMLENAVYSVISPEGCASILWRSADKARDAADALRLTAEDLRGLGVIDATVPEPVGGAHRDPESAIAAVGDEIERSLRALIDIPGGELRARRREKFMRMGRNGLG